MEIKAILKKPYNYKERAKFVSEFINCEFFESENGLQAWGKTQEEQAQEDLENTKENIKQIRNSMIDNIEWRVSRAREQAELNIKCVDNYTELLEYKQYLRDYTQIENWWEQEPKTFEEWRENEES